jgi:hypothetical protein
MDKPGWRGERGRVQESHGGMLIRDRSTINADVGIFETKTSFHTKLLAARF